MAELKIKKIRPIFNHIVTTANFAEETIKGGVIIPNQNPFSEYQEVVAVGNAVTTIKEGEVVKINPKRYLKVKQKPAPFQDEEGVISHDAVVTYDYNILEIGDSHYLLLSDSDVEYVIEDFEVVENYESSLILPEEKQLIV